MKKRVIGIALAVLMLLSLLPATALAEDTVASGDFGSYGSGTWSLDSEGLLTISGEVGLSGQEDDVPWYSLRESVKSVTFASGSFAKTGASLANMFQNCNNLTSIDLSSFDTSAATDMTRMFQSCESLTSLDLSSFDTSAVTNMKLMFDGCESLTSLDLSSFDTSAVTDMYGMFLVCESLTSLDLSSFDTSAVTNMGWMFKNCESLTSLDLSSFDTSAVTNMGWMFQNCELLTSLDLSSFDTSAVTDMSYMFQNCELLTPLDLSSFDTSAVTNMYAMFHHCASLTSLDLSNFDTSAVTNMNNMFGTCYSLTSLDLSSFDTSAVTDMGWMFYSCSCDSLTSLDLSSFDTSAVTNMSKMFAYCLSLTSLDLSNFDTSAVTNMSNMFENCGKAVEGVPAKGLVRNTEEAEKLNDSSKTKIDVNNLMFKVMPDYTLVLSGGNGYKNSVEEGNKVDLEEYGITSSGITYTFGGVEFNTKAAKAVQIEDEAVEIVLAAGSENSIIGGDSDGEDVYGIYSEGSLTISGSGALDVSTGDADGEAKNCYGIYARNITVNDGAVTVTGGDITGTTGVSYGVYLMDEGDIKVTGGTVTLKGETEAVNKAPNTQNTDGDNVMRITAGANSEGTEAAVLSNWNGNGTDDISSYKYIKLEPHTHTYSDEWSKDEAQHWHAANCEHTSEKKDVEAHMGSAANCTNKPVCTVCGQEYGTVDPAVHASPDEFSYSDNNDGATHTKKHACCEAVVDESEAHIFVGGECICGAMEPDEREYVEIELVVGKTAVASQNGLTTALTEFDIDIEDESLVSVAVKSCKKPLGFWLGDWIGYWFGKKPSETCYDSIIIFKGQKAGDTVVRVGEVYYKIKVTEPHVHSYNRVVVEPTCTEKGYTTYSCECGNRYVGDYVSAIGHNYDENGICTRCEAERPTSFAPKSFTASISKSSVTACKPVTITVKASTDVEYVMINGIKIDSYRTITSGWLFSRTAYRIFTYTINEAATGSYSYEIYAYNAEGAKSDTSRTVKLKVQESGSFWWK